MDIVEFREKVRLALADSGALAWTNAALDEAARQALADFNLIAPRTVRGQLTLSETGDTASLKDLTGFLDLLDLRCTMGKSPRGWTQFWDGDEPLVRFSTALPAGTLLDLLYAVPQTIAGLDEAPDTSLNDAQAAILARGTAGHAALQRGLALSEEPGGKPTSGEALVNWGEAMLELFSLALDRLQARPLILANWEEESAWTRSL